jgi:acetolactate synthase-1/3 small subunit
VNVVNITELAPEEAVERELLLVTVGAGASPAAHGDLVALVGEHQGTIVDDGADRVTVMLAGTPSRVDDFEDLVRPFGIVELQRTGLVALPKLSAGTAPQHGTAPLHSGNGALQGEAG